MTVHKQNASFFSNKNSRDLRLARYVLNFRKIPFSQLLLRTEFTSRSPGVRMGRPRVLRKGGAHGRHDSGAGLVTGEEAKAGVPRLESGEGAAGDGPVAGADAAPDE